MRLTTPSVKTGPAPSVGLGTLAGPLLEARPNSFIIPRVELELGPEPGDVLEEPSPRPRPPKVLCRFDSLVLLPTPDPQLSLPLDSTCALEPETLLPEAPAPPLRALEADPNPLMEEIDPPTPLALNPAQPF